MGGIVDVRENYDYKVPGFIVHYVWTVCSPQPFKRAAISYIEGFCNDIRTR